MNTRSRYTYRQNIRMQFPAPNFMYIALLCSMTAAATATESAYELHTQATATQEPKLRNGNLTLSGKWKQCASLGQNCTCPRGYIALSANGQLAPIPPLRAVYGSSTLCSLSYFASGGPRSALMGIQGCECAQGPGGNNDNMQWAPPEYAARNNCSGAGQRRPHDGKITVVYHLGFLGNWKDVARRQLAVVVRSGLLKDEMCRAFYIVVVGNSSYINELRALMLGIGIDNQRGDCHTTVTHGHQNTRAFEFPSLVKIVDVATRTPKSSILYLQSKGTFKASPAHHAWAQYMLHFLVTEYKVALAQTMNGADMVGVDFSSRLRHYSGNFWMARSDYIMSIHFPVDDTAQVVGDWNARILAEVGFIGAAIHGTAVELWHSYKDLRNYELKPLEYAGKRMLFNQFCW